MELKSYNKREIKKIKILKKSLVWPLVPIILLNFV